MLKGGRWHHAQAGRAFRDRQRTLQRHDDAFRPPAQLVSHRFPAGSAAEAARRRASGRAVLNRHRWLVPQSRWPRTKQLPSAARSHLGWATSCRRRRSAQVPGIVASKSPTPRSCAVGYAIERLACWSRAEAAPLTSREGPLRRRSRWSSASGLHRLSSRAQPAQGHRRRRRDQQDCFAADRLGRGCTHRRRPVCCRLRGRRGLLRLRRERRRPVARPSRRMGKGNTAAAIPLSPWAPLRGRAAANHADA